MGHIKSELTQIVKLNMNCMSEAVAAEGMMTSGGALIFREM